MWLLYVTIMIYYHDIMLYISVNFYDMLVKEIKLYDRLNVWIVCVKYT